MEYTIFFHSEHYRPTADLKIALRYTKQKSVQNRTKLSQNINNHQDLPNILLSSRNNTFEFQHDC